MQHLKHFNRVVATGLLVSVTACYTQRPLSSPIPQPATRVVAEITDAGTVAMGNALGPGAVEVEGVVAAADSSAWELLMVRVDHRGGTSIPWNRELVTVPRFALSNPTERRLDKTRSWLAAGIITASAFLAARLFRMVVTDHIEDHEPEPVNIVVPVGR